MMKKALYLLLIMMVLYPAVSSAQTEEGDQTRLWGQLEVTPPEGWFKGPPMGQGMFGECAAYARQDESVLLLACPGAAHGKKFADVLAEQKAQEGSITLERAVFQPQKGTAVLFAPLKKGDEGAMFIIMPGEPAEYYEGMLHRAWPMLAAFKNFAIPGKLSAPDIDPLAYAAAFSFQQSTPMPQWDAVTLAREDGIGADGKKRYVMAAIIPHFPVWSDVPVRLEWLRYFFGAWQPEGRHWKSAGSSDGMPCHAARSRDGKALIILRGIAEDDPAKLQHYQKMFDKFEW